CWIASRAVEAGESGKGQAPGHGACPCFVSRRFCLRALDGPTAPLPLLDPALEVQYPLDAARLEQARRDRGPAAALALEHDRPVAGDLLEPVGQVAEGNVGGARDVAGLPLG